jgi:hypothetical protein
VPTSFSTTWERAYLGRNVDSLATEGRLVVIGLQGGATAELDLGKLLRKRGAVIATALRSRPPEEKASIVASVEANVWPSSPTRRFGRSCTPGYRWTTCVRHTSLSRRAVTSAKWYSHLGAANPIRRICPTGALAGRIPEVTCRCHRTA